MISRKKNSEKTTRFIWVYYLFIYVLNFSFNYLETLPQLYNETQKRKELIREVEMGPFKHEVDDGLDLRKAAFECMYTLLDTCIDRLDIFEFLTHVQDGLKDHYDIKVIIFKN